MTTQHTCTCSHEAVAKLLIDGGANVNQANRKGTPPLYVAVEQGHDAVAKLLIDCDADVNQANQKGATPSLPPRTMMRWRGC